jgi:hypothetical protein
VRSFRSFRSSVAAWAAGVCAAGCLLQLLLAPAPAQAGVLPFKLGGGGDTFDKGTRTLQLSGGYYVDVKEGDEEVAHASLAGGYYLFNNFSANLSLDGYALDTEFQDTYVGGGITLLFRYHFLEIGDRFTMYLDGGAGVIYSDKEIPDFGTHFNFTPQASLGATFRVYDNVHLFGGARYFHISNAAIQGVDENPGLDAVGGYVGLMFDF